MSDDLNDDDSSLNIPLYTSPCGYFENYTNHFFLVSIPDDDSKSLYYFDSLMHYGFRRSGDIFYSNACKECSRCIPIRIPVKDFKLSKKYRRILNINSDIKIENVPPQITDEKINLFQKYNSMRHNNKDNCMNHLMSLHNGYVGIHEMDYFIDNKLVAVGILDLGENSSSSNYFYFDPDYSKRSLGIFSVLKEIEFTQESGRDFYYLGFYIEESPKMCYKSQYQPAQLRLHGKWTDFDKTNYTAYKSSTKENK